MKYFMVAGLLLAGCTVPSDNRDLRVTCPDYNIEETFYDSSVWVTGGSIIVNKEKAYPANYCFVESI